MKLISFLKKENKNIVLNDSDTEDIYTEIGHNIDSFVDKSAHSKINEKYGLIEFFDIIKDIISNDTVKQMKHFRQHCNTSCYKHCMQVAYFTYISCKALKLDYISATRAAMLHDLFLYDWRKRQPDRKGLHAFTHGRTACDNASKLFNLNDKEKYMIIKHMWPVTFSLPRYRESYIVTIMDKYSACLETYLYIQSKLKRKTFYRYAYIFLSVIFFRLI